MVTAVAYRLAEHSRQIAQILSEFRLSREQLLEVRMEGRGVCSAALAQRLMESGSLSCR